LDDDEVLQTPATPLAKAEAQDFLTRLDVALDQVHLGPGLERGKIVDLSHLPQRLPNVRLHLRLESLGFSDTEKEDLANENTSD
jgi:hypothetical protein